MKNGQIFALIFALIFAAVLSSGCSTQPANGSASNETTQPVAYYTYGTTSQPVATSYTKCVNVLTQFGYQQQCYQVANTSATSYSQYSLSSHGFAKGVSQENLQSAYVTYLNGLDDDSAADMKEQFDALIESYTK